MTYALAADIALMIHANGQCLDSPMCEDMEVNVEANSKKPDAIDQQTTAQTRMDLI